MTRKLIAVAAAFGVLVAVAVALTRDTPAPRSTSPTSVVRAPAVRLVGGEALPIIRAHPDRRGVIAGTDQIAARAPDPRGGPDWAVRTYQRPALQRRGRVWCAQLGRIVDGAFAWVQPGATLAQGLPLGYRETTVCANTSPTSERLGIAIAGLPTRSITDSRARIGTTVVWGVIDQPVKEARLEHASLGGALKLAGHAILRVEDGPLARASWARLVVTDDDGGRRAATPFILSQGMMVPIGGGYGRWDRRAPKDIPVPKDKPFVLTARVDATDDGVPRGIFANLAPDGRRCATDAVPIVGDRGIAPFGEHSGLVVQVPMLCTPLPAMADKMPIVIRGLWSTGKQIEPGTPAAAARDRRRSEDRLDESFATITVATPPGTRMLAVRSPVGAKTVRVTSERITTVAWRGQPEVLPALFPESRNVPGRQRSRVPPRVVWLEALDAAGNRIGRVGTTRPQPLTVAIRDQLAANEASERPAPTGP